MKKLIYMMLAVLLVVGSMMLVSCEPEEHVHSFESAVIDPTCIKQGYTEHTCLECGYVKRDTFVPASEEFHAYEKVEDVDSTCTLNGYTKEACSWCGDEIVTEKDLKKHSYGEWYATVESTCVSKGTQRRDCNGCDAYEEKDLALASHTYGEWEVSVVAGCDGGEEKHTCSVCGDVKTRATAPVHQFGFETTEPTCVDYGYKTATCDLCSYSEKRDYVDPKGHDYVGTVTDPTCEDYGFTTYTCSVCEDSYDDDFVDALGHDYASVVTDPTCNEMGYTTYTCNACDHSYTDSYVSPVHNFGEWTVVIPASCPALGLEERTCGCGHKEERAIVPEHVYEAVVTAPTYNEVGYTTYTCACGDTYVADEVPVIYTEGMEYKLLSNNEGYILVNLGDFEGDTVIIPVSVEGIEGCGVLPVVQIRHNAFEGNEAIVTVIIPETVNVIGISAFENCANLTSIIYCGTIEQWNSINKGVDWDLGTGNYTVYCIDGELTK